MFSESVLCYSYVAFCLWSDIVKAIVIFTQMKKSGLKVEPVAYTGLFIACAHSPWPTTDGLQRATQLRSYLLERKFQFNQITCHAMIKGMCDFCVIVKVKLKNMLCYISLWCHHHCHQLFRVYRITESPITF